MAKKIMIITACLILLMTCVQYSEIVESTEGIRQGPDGTIDYYLDNGMARNVYWLFSQKKEFKNWRLTDLEPGTDGANNVNKADLNSSYNSRMSALVFNFPYDTYPLNEFTANYEAGVTPYVNLTINTNFEVGKVVNFEIRFDTNGDGTFETNAMFNPFTTTWDQSQHNGNMREEYIRTQFAGYSNGLPGNMNDGMIQLAFWRTDGITDDPRTAPDEDWLTIYCGAYSKKSWVALPYKWPEISPIIPRIQPDADGDSWLDTPADPSSPHYNGYVTNRSIMMDGSEAYSPLGLNLSYFWSFGDGWATDIGATAVVNFTYPRAGIHHIELWVTDTNLRTGYASAWIEVLDVPPDTEPPALVSDDTPITGTTGDDLQFNITSSDNVGVKIVFVNWEHGDLGGNISLERIGDFWLDNITLDHSTDAMAYTVHLIDQSNNHFSCPQRSVTVIDNDPPEYLDATVPAVWRTGESIDVSVKASDNIGVDSVQLRYTMDGLDHSMIALEHFDGNMWNGTTTIPVTAVFLNYSFIIRDHAGNELDTGDSPGTERADVLDTIPPVVKMDENIVIDQHDTAYLSGDLCRDNIGIDSITWAFTYDGMIREFSGSDADFIFDIAGTYNVSVTVKDGTGNTGTGHLTVIVRDVTPPVAEAGKNVSKNEGATVILNGTSSTDNTGIVNYTWSFEYWGFVKNLYGEAPTFRFDIPGTYNVVLTVRDLANNTNMDLMEVEIRDVSVPFANASVKGKFVGYDDTVVITKGGEVELDASGSHDNGGPLNITWQIESEDGTLKFYGERPSHVFERSGNYKVKLTVTDQGGNQDVLEFDIEVSDDTPAEVETGEERWGTIVLGTLAGLVALALITVLLCLLYRKRKGKKEGGAEEIDDYDGGRVSGTR